ncbi:MAG: NAD-dependent epimerase/dehydratase family protein, partial [Hyphomicrobiaceae bacterium]|nr:NAD-dependent epimerase/dehydratase family protein [Hyphomicrobiaceae bacterium]
SLVKDVDAVVHVAGLAHSSPEIPERVYQAINCQAARALAQASRESGVRRFIYVSSVRAQTGSSADTVLTEADEPAPTDAYGRSKLAGEQTVLEALAGSQMDAVILRPVLMYGPNAKGNMATLMRLARSRLPLPLGGLPARRSLLGLTNFSDAVAFALNAPTVSGRTFLLADAGAPLTVGEMVAALRAGLGRRSGIVQFPLPGLEKLLVAAGKADMAGRVFGDLVVSTDALVSAGWQAPMTSAQGLAAVMTMTGD